MEEEIKHPCLKYIGHEAVFFIPAYKLTTVVDGVLIRDKIHKFLSENYKGYTVADSLITGFWIGGERAQIFNDSNVEYRVAFEGRPRVTPFVEFLAVLCRDINEDALYLKMGKKSYLVTPK